MTDKDLYDLALALDKLRENTHAAMRIEQMVNMLAAAFAAAKLTTTSA